MNCNFQKLVGSVVGDLGNPFNFTDVIARLLGANPAATTFTPRGSVQAARVK